MVLDKDRIGRLLDEIRRSLRVAEEVVSLSLEDFLSDVRNRYTLRLALVEVVEAAAVLGLHILRERFGEEEIEGYARVFEKLANYGVVSRDVGESMRRLARLRNIIVHRYWEVDDARIYREARGNGLEAIRKFVREVEEYVSRARED